MSAEAVAHDADSPSAQRPRPRRLDVEDAASHFAVSHLAEDHPYPLAYDFLRKCWRVYRRDFGYWFALPDDEPGLDEAGIKSLEALGMPRTPANIDSTLRLARRYLQKEFDAPRRAIAFANGTLEIETGHFREHRPDDNLPFGLPHDYTPDEAAPISDRLLEERIPDLVAHEAFRTHIGLALMGDTSFHHALLLIGGPATGKTTLLRLFNIVLGQAPDQFASSALFLRDHEGQLQRHVCRDWLGVALDESPDEALRHEDTFKAMTSHSGVTSRMHNKAPVNDQWRPKVVMATNDEPKIIDKSGAVERRLLVIAVPNAVLEGAWDRSLTDKLMAEAGAFAAQCLVDARRAIQRNEYPISDAMREAFEELAGESDPIKAWVRERCVLTTQTGRGHKEYTSRLYDDWRAWAEENGHHAGSLSWLSRRLRGYPAWRITWGKDHTSSFLLGVGLRAGEDGSAPGWQKGGRNATHGGSSRRTGSPAVGGGSSPSALSAAGAGVSATPGDRSATLLPPSPPRIDPYSRGAVAEVAEVAEKTTVRLQNTQAPTFAEIKGTPAISATSATSATEPPSWLADAPFPWEEGPLDNTPPGDLGRLYNRADAEVLL